MKKNYLKPEAEILDFVVANMIATSGNTTVKPGENAGSGDPEEARGHRGEWGSIWN